MTERIAHADFPGLGLDDWRVILDGIEANFECGSYTEAGRFAADLAALCDAHDHHAAIDLRYPDLVHVMSTTHFMNGLTDRDIHPGPRGERAGRRARLHLSSARQRGAGDRDRRHGHRRGPAVLAGG